MTLASGLETRGTPLRLEGAFRRNGHIVWVLRAGDDTWWYTITSEGLADTVLPSDLLALATTGPFATEAAATAAGLKELA